MRRNERVRHVGTRRTAVRTDPDIVLMDLPMPAMDGVEATRRITAAVAGAQVVVLTSFSDHQRILDAAAGGGAPLDPKAARVLLDSRHPRAGRTLTAREEEVLALLGDGMADKAVARRLGIAERTVKAHLGSIFQQLGVSDRTQAALWARSHPRSGSG